MSHAIGDVLIVFSDKVLTWRSQECNCISANIGARVDDDGARVAAGGGTNVETSLLFLWGVTATMAPTVTMIKQTIHVTSTTNQTWLYKKGLLLVVFVLGLEVVVIVA